VGKLLSPSMCRRQSRCDISDLAFHIVCICPAGGAARRGHAAVAVKGVAGRLSSHEGRGAGRLWQGQLEPMHHLYFESSRRRTSRQEGHGRCWQGELRRSSWRQGSARRGCRSEQGKGAFTTPCPALRRAATKRPVPKSSTLMMYGAQVFQVRKRDTGRIYAMKVMRKVRSDSRPPVPPQPCCISCQSATVHVLARIGLAGVIAHHRGCLRSDPSCSDSAAARAFLPHQRAPTDGRTAHTDGTPRHACPDHLLSRRTASWRATTLSMCARSGMC